MVPRHELAAATDDFGVHDERLDGGIGKGIGSALALLREGAGHVVGIVVDERPLDAVVNVLRVQGGRAAAPFGKLRRADLVSSTRGPGGGYTLGRKADDITVADIILSVDEPLDATHCGGKENCHGGDSRCMTHDLWASLNAKMVEFLDSVSLQKLVDDQISKGVVIEAGVLSLVLEDFKNAFDDKYGQASKKFHAAIQEIDRAIKQLEKAKEDLLGSENNLRLANQKAADVTIKRLTRGNPTMTKMFRELEGGANEL